MQASENAAESRAVILPFESSEEYYVESLGEIEKKPVFDFVKRAFDIAFSLFFFPALLPLMAVVALLVKLTSKGRVFYRQERLGLNGKKFHLVKFRTMIPGAEEEGIRWSMGDDDPRITPLGRILRKTHLDELPQLWCILKGDMSLVGPRPERPVYYERFEQYIHGFHERLKVKPGLTGLAQVCGGYHLRPEEKVQYDVQYIKNRSLRQELWILLKTVKVVFCCEGVK